MAQQVQKITRLSCLEGAGKATGLVVIIDVFRAFSCAPLFFYFGANRVILEADPDKALELKHQIPSSILAGEVNEVPIKGGDMGNSPTEAISKGRAFFEGKTVIHRTTAGVTGVHAASGHCDTILLGSFVTASSIAKYVKGSRAVEVSLVAMGTRGKAPSPEDEACADYIEHLVTGKPYDHVAAMERIVFHESARKFIMGTKPYLPREDPIFCLQRDVFDFVIIAEKRGGLLEAKMVRGQK